MSAMEKKDGKKKNVFSPIAKYFREVKSELKKVVFPTAKQTRINTTVVIVAVIIVGILIGVLDLAFNAARNFVINYDSTQTEEQATDATQTTTDDAMQQATLTLEEAQAIMAELDGYTYNEAGDAIDENGEVITLDDGQGNVVQLTADVIEQRRAEAQSVIDAEGVSVDAEATETTEAPEGGNE